MFCKKCGKELNEGAAFCIACGTPQGESPAVAQPAPTPTTKPHVKKLHCPECKSTNLDSTTESSVTSGISTGRNIRTTSYSNEHKTFWLCKDCGRKFRNIQSLEEEIEKGKKNQKWYNIFTVVAGAISVLLLFMLDFSGLMFFFSMSIFVCPAVVFIVCIFAGMSNKKRIAKAIEELKYLKENCFD